MRVDCGFSCGRYYLEVQGYVVAMELDVCRDWNLTEKFKSQVWTKDMIKYVVKKARDDEDKLNPERVEDSSNDY